MNRTLLLAGVSTCALVLAAQFPAYAADGARAEAIGNVNGFTLDPPAITPNTAIDEGSQRDNMIEDSWNDGATGIVHNQQNNGSNNAVGAATAVHADVTGGTSVDSGAHAESSTSFNNSTHMGDNLDPDRGNRILNTMDGFVGSATLQQNNGDNNAINAATAIDGIDGNTDGLNQSAKAVADTEDQGGFEGFMWDENSNRSNLINPSFNGAQGTFTVQQNNGNANAISSATAIAGVTGDAGGLDQSAKTFGAVNGSFLGHKAFSRDSERVNTIRDSFNQGFAGQATVQQNNGDGNAISAATAVAAVGGDAGELVQAATSGPAAPIHVPDTNGPSFVIVTESENAADNERLNLIDPSFVGAHGILTVQQNNGNNNAINASTAVAAHVASAGDVDQAAVAAGIYTASSGNTVTDSDALRDNKIIDGSFDDASGVMTVQQNNGDANGMYTATSVLGVAGDTGNIDQSALSGLFSTSSSFNETRDTGSDRNNLIQDSFNGIEGIATVQQNNGNANHMAAGAGLVFAGGTAGTIDQQLLAGGSESASAINDSEDDDTQRSNLIDPALATFDSVQGIVTVQQNNGDANNMFAMNAVTATAGSSAISQNIHAENNIVDNNVDSDGALRHNEILQSFNNLKGIATVQQNNGDGNGISAGTGIAAAVGDSGDIDQRVIAQGLSDSSDLMDDDGTRSNLIDPSFTDAEGVITVQQNNGAGNVMAVATGVVFNRGGDGDVSQTVDADGIIRPVFSGKTEGNETFDVGSDRDNTVTDSSFSGLKGVATVQQNNGDGNVMTVGNGVAAKIGDGILGNTDQSVSVTNSVEDNFGSNSMLDTRRNTLDGSVFNSAQGLVTVQQNNGSNNAIGAANAVRADIGGTADDGDEEDVTSQITEVEGDVIDNTGNEVDPYNIVQVDRDNVLTDSFKGGVNGVFIVQQNNGNNNAMGAATAVAANIDGTEDIDGVTSSTASTDGDVTGNNALATASTRENTADGGVFNGAAGIVTVQQNNGNNNAIGAATGVVANVNTANSFGDAVTADASGVANVDDNFSDVTAGVRRDNDVVSAFDGVAGIATVQQNNGDNNVIGAATEVVASTELPGFGPAASTASLSATVTGNTAAQSGGAAPEYDNLVSSSFTGASGVITVQQNNGNNNAMGSAITTVANGISFGFNGGNP